MLEMLELRLLSIFYPKIEIGTELIDALLESYEVLMLGLAEAHVEVLFCFDVEQLIDVNV